MKAIAISDTVFVLIATAMLVVKDGAKDGTIMVFVVVENFMPDVVI